MKWILIFLCLPAFGQLPVLPFAPQNTSTFFEPSNVPGLFVELVSDNNQSLTNTSNGSSIASWINLKFLGDVNFQNFIPLGSVGFVGPTYSSTGGPINQACVNWASANLSQLAQNSSFGSNQPITIFLIFTPINNASLKVLTDTANPGATGRIVAEFDNANNAFFAGSTIFGPNSRNAWQLWSIVFNGANSYLRTNGVLCISGNGGANAMGKWALGNDTTLSSQFLGKMACVLAYNGALNTNTLQSVEAGLKTRFFNGVYP